MSYILHVLNGDATYKSFKNAGLEGDVLIWREVLSEGPLIEDISSAEFWSMRSEWVTKTFHDTPENYQEKVIKQLGLLNKSYDEINLWFEFDLHCQVNLLGVMMLLMQKADLTGPSVYLICPTSFPGKSVFKGMGELDANELDYLYDNSRVQLSEYDFKLADEAWKVYLSNDSNKIKNWLEGTGFMADLTALKAAFQAHITRITVNSNGLNYIEQTLLEIYNSGITQKLAVYNKFWKTQVIYGMGDAELDIYWNRLEAKQLINPQYHD